MTKHYQVIHYHNHDFNTGLCDCFDDCSSFLDGWFCAYCEVSAQYNMLTNGRPGVDLCVCTALLCADLWLCLGFAITCMTVFTRSGARERFHLHEEGAVGGCCKGFWCGPCSICQVYREMSIRHAWPGGVCVDAPYHKRGLNPPEPQYMGVDVVIVTPAVNQPHHKPHGSGGSTPQHEPYNNGPVANSYGTPPPNSYGLPPPQPSPGHHGSAHVSPYGSNHPSPSNHQNNGQSPYGHAQYTSQPQPL
ncbi:ama1 protein, putative [Bodo saltans]|uniref:Ama1 protein, putative n=1 Tax=Bodo saltans TaxID=75058 RepID=A0A0S4IV30_BODSA|nr:ama1 protein, putative [Bodo saltans]|eukprot:CUG15320.1 ama1 protein, putative [Bodo saltans]